MRSIRFARSLPLLLAGVLACAGSSRLCAQAATGQYRLFIPPFAASDVSKKEIVRFHQELSRLLGESGRYELVTADEVKALKRDLGINVRAPLPDTLYFPGAQQLGARILLRGDLETTQAGTIRARATLFEVLTKKEKDLGGTEISIGTDITVLAQSLADRIFRRADVDKFMDFGRDYMRSHIYDRAAQNFERAIALDSTIVEAYYDLGNARLQLADTTAAIGLFEQTIARDSTYAEAAYRLANLYMQRKAFQPMITLFEAMMRIDPGNQNFFLYAGIAYQRADRLDEALAAYGKGRELGKDKHLFCDNMGRIYYQLEKYDLAAENLEEVARAQPENIDVLQYLAACYNRLSDWEAAIGAYERILAINPAYPNGYKNLGIWYGKMKKYDEAARALEKGLESSPEAERDDIYLALADVYLKAGRFEKVIQIGNQALRYRPNTRIYVFLGDAYQAIGEGLERKNTSESYQKAIENYEASTGNYDRVVGDSKYGQYARKNIERNKSLIDRAELIIKKLRLEEGT